MTTEAVIAKMMWALAYSDSRESFERLFQRPVGKDKLEKRLKKVSGPHRGSGAGLFGCHRTVFRFSTSMASSASISAA